MLHRYSKTNQENQKQGHLQRVAYLGQTGHTSRSTPKQLVAIELQARKAHGKDQRH